MSTSQTTNRDTPAVGDQLWWLWLLPLTAAAYLWWAFSSSAPNWLVSEQTTWYLTRSSGLVAYLMLSFSTVWGILLSTKLMQKVVPPAVSLAMHNYLAWSSIGFVGFHALILLWDNYYSYQLADLLIPFTGPYEPFAVGLGVMGLYIMIVTSASFYLRQQIGQRRWRLLHYTTFGSYALATAHGFLSGTDTAQLSWLYLGSGLAVLFLTIYRIISAGK